MDKQNKKMGQSIIEGIIIPEKWDDDGKITGVTIQTNNENVYLVEHTRVGHELLNLIHEKVKAQGKIRERMDGHTLIAVQSYQKVEEKFNNDLG